MNLSVDIEKHFDGFNLTASFEAGNETVGLLGASGCGKSLTLRCIAGIETPDAGKIVLNGTTFFDKASGKKARINMTPQKRKTALLFQNYQLFPNLTVKQNIGAGIDPHFNTEKQNTLIHEQLERFGLTHLSERYPLQLSGGQQQRVALARMLAANPAILMLDEPFSALDAHLKSSLEQDLQQLFEHFEGTILYVSHDIDEAFRFCDRIAVMSEGHIEELDTKERIIYHPQTLATLRLSGCKNTTSATYVDQHHVHLPEWNITVRVDHAVSPNVNYCGIRAKFIEYASGIEVDQETNTFWVRVEHISDSRFERTALVRFIPTDNNEYHVNHPVEFSSTSSRKRLADKRASNEVTSSHLAGTIQWHLNKLTATHPLPEVGDVCLITFNKNGLYFTDR